MHKIIGIDIDGVITDEIHPNQNVWHNALCEYLGYDIERVKDSYYFDEAYDLSGEVVNSFLEEYLVKIYKNAKIASGARETINLLYNNDFKIHLITARDPEFKEVTTKWLASQQIKYSSLTHDDDKAPLAVKKNITVFIEDNAYNARVLSENGIKVFLFNKYHNLELATGQNIIRVDKWSEIKKHLFNLYSLK